MKNKIKAYFLANKEIGNRFFVAFLIHLSMVLIAYIYLPLPRFILCASIIGNITAINYIMYNRFNIRYKQILKHINEKNGH